MKITAIDVIRCKPQPYLGQTAVLCRVHTDNGLYGYGEAGVSIMNFSLASYELMKVFGKMLIGRDPLDTDAIYDLLINTFWAQGNGGVILAAISALDTALWDIKGKYFGVPLYVLLGGKHRDQLRCYASQLQNGWHYRDFLSAPGDPGFLRDACLAAVEEGYDAVKVDFLTKRLDGSPIDGNVLKTHIPPELMREFITRVEVVREAIGPDRELILENHNLTSAATAIEFARAAEPYGVAFLEEPVFSTKPHEYKKLYDHLDIPIATGERAYTRDGFLPLLETGYVSIIQPDLGNCGGVTEGRKICDLAQLYGASVQTHTCNTPISVAVSLQLEAAIPNFIIHEHHTANTLPEVREMCVYDDQPVNGFFSVPDRPGIGNELSEKALAEATIETVR